MRVSLTRLGAAVTVAFLVGGGCGSTAGGECPPVGTWEKLNGEPCDSDGISCSDSAVCSDYEHFTASPSLNCDGGTWRSGHSDDECCPFADEGSVVGQDCSYAGDGVRCHSDPELSCGVAAIICTDGVWTTEEIVAGFSCAGAGGEGGQGGRGGASGATSGGASPDSSGGVGGGG